MRRAILAATVTVLGCSVPTAANAQSTSSKKVAPTQATSAAGDGKQIFLSGTTPSCAVCHALKDAGATGNVGPDLDQLRPDEERVARAVKLGFEAMPPFGHVLSDAQIQSVARYVAKASGHTPHATSNAR